MSDVRSALAYRRLRAPREPDGVLVDPRPSVLAEVLRANQAARRERARMPFGPFNLEQLTQEARGDLLRVIREHAARFELPLPDPLGVQSDDKLRGDSFLITGHQPQLFHPGVWFKNFVLANAARRTHSLAVNLIIDNDTERGTSIKVPTGVSETPRAVAVAWDAPGDEVPYEQRSLRDSTLFESFPRRVTRELSGVIDRPLVETLWPAALAARRHSTQPGLLLSVARQTLEHRLGLATLDAPLSAIADGPAFRRFALVVLDRALEFCEYHNAVLGDYRRSHRIRSRSHPVPELARDGDWVESPLWCWTDESPRRRRLFVRRRGRGIELTDRAGWRETLDAIGDGSGGFERAVEAWSAWRTAGVKIRPRALLTTLFARLLLGDLFVHGIGGAKYDQLTDALFARFLNIEPPTFVTATATICLPIAHDVVTADDVRALEQRWRESRFHPERWLTPAQLADDYVAGMLAEKRKWLAQSPPRGLRLTRHRALGAINEALQPYLESQRDDWHRQLEFIRHAARRHALLASREYSYCLFSQNDLPRRLLELSTPAS